MLMARIVAAWPGHVVCPRAYTPDYAGTVQMSSRHVLHMNATI